MPLPGALGGEERPPPAPVTCLTEDDDWTVAEELGFLARVFNQDTFNMPKMQIGLRTMKKPGVTFAIYQETKIRHFHTLLDEWLARDNGEASTARPARSTTAPALAHHLTQLAGDPLASDRHRGAAPSQSAAERRQDLLARGAHREPLRVA